ncbi:modification methylase BanI [Catenibacterium mitsuokai DSM 15897]|uniref:DNA (cytosine-5-)-methyltransferase n=1 Tax=Catenibacterium mitsuokai TaxID=100886 RepID=UPI000196C281|nr:DNA (cytosine-5-)-methyltransferase [Catenibacterium mitsuokai]EEF93028.1 modification methylase BanI [Catenibacterium mitsuokai DSM 15897]UWO54426.1 DNA (cytosine-5-)-methyltransferase [Catenibacterium mitsuokai]
MNETIKFVDLFAGIGGIRKGFELACSDRGVKTECVFTSEIKPYAIKVLKQNHPNETITGDITQVDATKIPDFDFLLGGFPCQAFSAAGKRLGFEDTRGTLFFDVERIMKEKRPYGFVLENVEGLVNHDKENPKDKIGRTLTTILEHLEALGYKVSWRVLNAKYFGIPQERKRIYIVGTKKEKPNLEKFHRLDCSLADVLETGIPTMDSKFTRLLLKHYSVEELFGKAIKDKRGGNNNIHSWDIELKGSVSKEQRKLLNTMMTERRKKKWAEEYGIDWMDGMPLTIDMIRSFCDFPNLEKMLEDLVSKKYLRKEYPKRKVGNRREQDSSLPLGYNIVAGKMSFEVSKVLSPDEIAPTLVAMDMQHLFVPDGDGIRQLTLREGLRLFGYPDDYKFDVSIDEGYDLLGNTVVVPVIKAVSERVLDIYERDCLK